MSDITVYRKSDFDITFNYKNNDDSVRTLSGATVYFTVKTSSYDNDADDSEAIIAKDVTSHTDASNGITAIELTDDDTNIAPGNYFYDVVVVESNGDRHLAVKGRLAISSGPTNR